MSHLKERREKNCLNCNAQLEGRYCHICGQENTEPKESAWHLINHFFQDITHFDGKFFSTLKLLIFRPGFLSREYMAGRRASYLNPVRMYVFTSAFFFLIFFNFFSINEGQVVKDPVINGKTLEQVSKMDAASFAIYTSKINADNNMPVVPMSREEFKKYADSMIVNLSINIANVKYTSKAAYDSALAAGTIRHSWWKKLFVYKIIEIKTRYHNNGKLLMEALGSNLLHSLPQMLFISLPLLALLLKLFYFRRKNFFYADHGIFSIHLYIFVFIALLVAFGLAELNTRLGWGSITFLIGLIDVLLFVYEYKALRNFYQQRRGKTIVKFFLLNLFFLVVLILVFAVFFFLSIFKI